MARLMLAISVRVRVGSWGEALSRVLGALLGKKVNKRQDSTRQALSNYWLTGQNYRTHS